MATSLQQTRQGSYPEGVVAGSDGNIWFTEAAGMRIGRLNPTTGAVVEFSLPANHNPTQIVAAPDGILWFLESNQSLLGRITLSGVITEFRLPAAPCKQPGIEGSSSGILCQVEHIAIGPGRIVWFGEPRRTALGRVNAQGVVTEYDLHTSRRGVSGIGPVALGPDGALWFATRGTGTSGWVGRFVDPHLLPSIVANSDYCCLSRQLACGRQMRGPDSQA